MLGLPLVSPGAHGDDDNNNYTDEPLAGPSNGTDAAVGPLASPPPPPPAAPPQLPPTADASSHPNLVPLANGSNGLAPAPHSTRALGTRLARLEESVAAIDGKLERLLRLLGPESGSHAAAAAAAAAESLLLLPDSPGVGDGLEEEGDGDDEGSDGGGDGR